MSKTGRRLILADRTVIENGEAGYADGFLWLWFSGMTMQEASVIFFDPEKTAVIIFEYGEMKDRYEGFTNCRSISVSADGLISVCMTKEVNG